MNGNCKAYRAAPRLTLLAIVLSAVLGATHSAAQTDQRFDGFTPYTFGKAAGQVEWTIRQCGGRFTAAARTALERYKRLDPVEFERGYQEGMSAPGPYAQMMGMKDACTFHTTVFGPERLGFWERL